MSESQALKELKVSLSMAQSLASLEIKYFKNPPKREDQKAVEGLRGGAAILMVAGFERFLKNVFEERLQPLTIQPPKVAFNDLPEKMRINSTYCTLDLSMKGMPFSEKKTKIERLSDIEKACRIILSETINPLAFTNTGSNPNSETVKCIYKSIGITDIYSKLKTAFDKKWKKTEAPTFLSDKLDEIVNRRHVVAHEADALNIGRQDLKSSFKFLRILGELLDKELKDYIDSLIKEGRS